MSRVAFVHSLNRAFVQKKGESDEDFTARIEAARNAAGDVPRDFPRPFPSVSLDASGLSAALSGAGQQATGIGRAVGREFIPGTDPKSPQRRTEIASAAGGGAAGFKIGAEAGRAGGLLAGAGQTGARVGGIVGGARGAAIGGRVGAMVGLPAGPHTAVAGGVAGSVLGGLIGIFGFSAAERAAEAAGVDLNELLRKSNEQVLGDASLDAFFNTLLGGGGPAARAVGTRLIRWFQKIGPEGRETAESASELGVPLGIQDVSDRTLISGMQQVLGKFLFLTKPFKTSIRAKSGAIRRSADNLFFQLGPVVSMADAGTLDVRAAEATYASSRKIIDDAYDKFRSLDKEFPGTTTPTAITRRLAEQMTEEAVEDAPQRIVKGKRRPVEDPSSLGPRVDKWIASLADLEPNLTVRQYANLQKKLQNFLEETKAAKQDALFQKLTEVKKAMESDFEDVTGPPQVIGALESAKTKMRSLMGVFDTPTGQKFKKVDKNIFGVGFVEPGSKNADQMHEIIWEANSPEAMTDLRVILGEEQFFRTVRRFLDDVFANNSFERTVRGDKSVTQINVPAIRNVLGLGKGNNNPEMMRTMLRGSGVSPSEVRGLLDVIEAAQRGGFVDVSQFAARRAQLAGLASLSRTVAPGVGPGRGGFSLTTAGAVTSLLLLRHFGNVVTSPQKLRAATRALDPNITATARRNANTRFMRMMFGARPSEPREVQDEATAVPGSAPAF